MSVAEILEINPGKQEDQRLTAAFFTPDGTSPTDLYGISESFYERSKLHDGEEGFALFPEASGVVYYDSDEVLDTSTTLLFDATGTEGSYLWQLTETNQEGREIRELRLSQLGAIFSRVKFDKQGRLSAQDTPVDQDTGVKKLWDSISGLIASDRFTAIEAGLKAKKESAAKRLADFEDDRLVHIDLAHFEGFIVVSGEKFEKVRGNLTDNLRNIGFVGLKPYKLSPQ